MSEVICTHRYNSIAIILHWVMALGFAFMFSSGIVMTYIDLDQGLKFCLYQWHKASGVLLLLAFCLRGAWRVISIIFNQIPPLPKNFHRLEKMAAIIGHWGLYILMLVVPISGWVMVSSSVYGLPTIVFGWFEWPHIPNLQGNENVESLAKEVHFFLAIFFALMITVHIAAVVKHALSDNVNLIKRMWWSGK